MWTIVIFPLLIYPVVLFRQFFTDVSWHRMTPSSWHLPGEDPNGILFLLIPGLWVAFFIMVAVATHKQYSKRALLTLIGTILITIILFMFSEVVLWLLVYGD